MADENMNTIHITEKQKVQEITDKLEEGLKELFESEKYKTYLSTMSKFHNYSFNCQCRFYFVCFRRSKNVVF